MSDEKKKFNFGKLGNISIESLDEEADQGLASLSAMTIEELTDLNAYAIQSGCSACSASGMGFCC